MSGLELSVVAPTATTSEASEVAVTRLDESASETKNPDFPYVLASALEEPAPRAQLAAQRAPAEASGTVEADERGTTLLQGTRPEPAAGSSPDLTRRIEPSDEAPSLEAAVSDELSVTPGEESRRAEAPRLRIEPDLSLLDPDLRARLERVVERMRLEFGHNVKVIEAYRSPQRQEALYAQGRTAPGPIVTWTRSSLHTEGLAVDVMVDGSFTSHEGYRRLSAIAEQEGLQSLWPKDPGHLQLGPSEASRTFVPSVPTDSEGGAETGPFIERPARPAEPVRVATVASLAEVARPAAVATPGSAAPVQPPTGSDAPSGAPAVLATADAGSESSVMHDQAAIHESELRTLRRAASPGTGMPDVVDSAERPVSPEGSRGDRSAEMGTRTAPVEAGATDGRRADRRVATATPSTAEGLPEPEGLTGRQTRAREVAAPESAGAARGTSERAAVERAAVEPAASARHADEIATTERRARRGGAPAEADAPSASIGRATGTETSTRNTAAAEGLAAVHGDVRSGGPAQASLIVDSPALASPEALQRVSQIRELQELAYPRRLGQMTVRMMDGLSEEARMRVRLEDGGVSTRIGVRDLGHADMLRSRIGLLEQSLRLQGIAPHSVRVGALTTALDAMDASAWWANDSGGSDGSEARSERRQRDDEASGGGGRRRAGSHNEDARQGGRENDR